MNQKLLALYGLKFNPFSPELPVDAIYVPARIESFCWRIEHAQIREGGFAMVHALQQTLCDHAAGNYRILTTMAAELLAAAAQRDLPVLDEKLYLDVFAPPAKSAPRRVAAGR